MQTYFELGPSIEVMELSADASAPAVGIEPDGKRRVEFGSPETEVGGIVHIRFLPAEVEGAIPPVNLYAYYVSPADKVPHALRTPEWFFSDAPGVAKVYGSIPVDDQVPLDGTDFTIKVEGVKPGAHLLQLIYEYPQPEASA